MVSDIVQNKQCIVCGGLVDWSQNCYNYGTICSEKCFKKYNQGASILGVRGIGCMLE